MGWKAGHAAADRPLRHPPARRRSAQAEAKVPSCITLLEHRRTSHRLADRVGSTLGRGGAQRIRRQPGSPELGPSLTAALIAGNDFPNKKKTESVATTGVAGSAGSTARVLVQSASLRKASRSPRRFERKRFPGRLAVGFHERRAASNGCPAASRTGSQTHSMKSTRSSRRHRRKRARSSGPRSGPRADVSTTEEPRNLGWNGSAPSNDRGLILSPSTALSVRGARLAHRSASPCRKARRIPPDSPTRRGSPEFRPRPAPPCTCAPAQAR
jgi:hypothetical protein